jgi:hypothetical protein
MRVSFRKYGEYQFANKDKRSNPTIPGAVLLGVTSKVSESGSVLLDAVALRMTSKTIRKTSRRTITRARSRFIRL